MLQHIFPKVESTLCCDSAVWMILLDAGTKTILLDHEKIDFDKNVSVLVATNTSGIVPMSP